MQLERDLLRAFPIAATNISVADAGTYFTGTTVEAALQELGAGTAGPFVLRAGDTMTGNLNLTVSTFAATEQGTGIVAPNGTVIRGFVAYDSAGTATAAMGDADIGGGNFVSVVALAPTALQLGATIGVNTASFADEVAWLSTFDGLGLGDDDVDTSAGKYILIKKGDGLGGYRFRVAGATGATEINYQLASTSDVTNSLSVSHTLPTLPASSANAVNFNITSAGSASQNQIAVTASLAAGYTGSSFTSVFTGTNNVAGTATGWETGGSGNYGGRFFASGATAGENVGVGGSANASTFKNIGTGGRAISNTTGINIGVSGIASNASGVMIGGYFQLGGGLPTLTSAALMCDNGAQTSDIFVARDNGTSVMSIVDGGQVLIGTTTKQSIAGNTSALLQVATATASQRFNTFAYYKVDTIGANLSLAKSYSNTLNTLTYVATGVEIARINFASADEATSRFTTNAIFAATSQEAHTDTAKGTKLSWATTPIGSATAGVVMTLDSEGSLLVGGTGNPTTRFDLMGNLSLSALNNGASGRVRGATYTDTGTAASGTAGSNLGWVFGIPTFAATNLNVTMTHAATAYWAGPPTAGTNATITYPWVAWFDSGDLRVDGNISIFTSGNGIIDTNKNELLKFVTTASAVNQFQLTNKATAGRPVFEVTGDDTNVSMDIKSQGTGAVFLGFGNSAWPVNCVSATSTSSLIKYYTSSASTLRGSFGYFSTSASFAVVDDVSTGVIASFKQVTTGVNYLEMTNAVTTAAPALSALGSDTNIGITLTPKGIGKLFFNGAQKVIRTTVADQAYQVLGSDYIVAYTSISATRIVTLVAAATAGAGAVVIIKDESGSVTPAIKITVDGDSAELIDGVASIDITAPYGVLRLYCNGTAWFTF